MPPGRSPNYARSWRPVRAVLGLLALCCLALPALGAADKRAASEKASASPAPTQTAPNSAADPAPLGATPRLISLNPSLTAIIVRLGRGETLVGVDEVSAELMPEVADLPRVGGLLNPSLESIVELRPDRVLIVAGVDQQSHGAALARLGLTVETFENERLDQVLENIERLGRALGRADQARARIDAILQTRAAVARAVGKTPRPATLAIVDRSPLFLVGGETFLDEMLDAVGADNLARRLGAGYPRGSIEWLIAARPELLLDMTPGEFGSAAFWARWPSLPAVQTGRVLTLDASRISLPGPDLDDALRELAVAVHGLEIEAAIDRELARARVRAAQGAPVRRPTPTPSPREVAR